MDWADAGNAAFELLGGALIWKDVHQLYRDKLVKGVYWPARGFFAAWGLWNVYYYGPRLDQWLSWWAGLLIVTANIVWLVMVLRYSRQAKELEGLQVRAQIGDL